MDRSPAPTRYRWYILILSALTNTLGVAIPSMCLPVLFKEISADLNLTLVQVGVIWGIGALPGIFTTLAGGAIADRFGPRRVLILGTFVVGLSGALRGLALNYAGLAASVFLFGFLSPFIGMNVIKTCGLWFSSRQLGLANGALSMGMALGFLIGSLISATWLSPLLGGWRNVILLYGVLAMALSIPWCFTRPSPIAARPVGSAPARPASMRQNLAHVLRQRNIWLLGLTILGVGGCIQGTLGYLPLYLQGLGWAQASADGALAAFHTASLIFVLPIALGSDHLGTRKKVMLASALLITLGVSLLSAAAPLQVYVWGSALVWVAVCTAGMVRDGFMAVFITAINETEAIGPAYAGTATGLVMVLSGLGSLIAPPLGNSLAVFAPGLPFLFWASLMALGFAGLLTIKDQPASQLTT